jgi:hypothetical protein
LDYLDDVLLRPIELHAGDAERRGCLNVSVPVSDHEASTKVDRPIASSLFEQSRLRLPTFALDCVSRDYALWMMRAHIKSVDPRAALLQKRLHVGMKATDCVFIVVPTSNAGLVRNHYNPKTCLV